MTWKDYCILTLLGALLNLGWLYYLTVTYPPMATYVNAVGKQMGQAIYRELAAKGAAVQPQAPLPDKKK
jgi:hypothetical protein